MKRHQRNCRFSGNNMMAKYVDVTYVQSMTREGVEYRIMVNPDSGHLTCSCPSFKFQRKEIEDRWCKHTTQIESMGGCEKLLVKAKEAARQYITEEDLIVWASG